LDIADTSAPPGDATGVTVATHAITRELRADMRSEMAQVVVGYREQLDLMLVAAVAGGHVLLEGPPGVAKTMMAAGLARVLGVHFKRIQFTPDTTPEDLIGTTVKKLGEPQFVPGAVFTNVLLADEINRTPARTQAALLEAMQERQVTVDGRIHWLPSPFTVIATQNPYEHLGIFELPESQLDRFLFKITLGYVSAAEEEQILRLPHAGLRPDLIGEVRPLLDVGRLSSAQQEIDAVSVPDEVVRHCVAIVRATREADGVVLGASPRAAVHLMTAAKAYALIDGRPTPDRRDVTAMAPFVLAHRLILAAGEAADVVRASCEAADAA
jgi:MoxR-like ATPase